MQFYESLSIRDNQKTIKAPTVLSKFQNPDPQKWQERNKAYKILKK
jgi:hypothetical protein